MTSLFRTGVLGSTLALCAAGSLWALLSACESLSQVSPLPPLDASDLDAGQPPEEEESSSSSSSGGLDAGSSNAVRFRLSNQLKGPDAIDYCVKSDLQGSVWENNLVSENENKAKPDGLFFGETSQVHISLTGPGAGSKFQVKIVRPGTDCADPDADVYATLAAPVTARQNTGVTVVAYGKLEDGVDAGDATGKVTTIGDTLVPPGTTSLFRVFHGATDIAAFDVVINGETILTGVKYGTVSGYPYTSATGYASIAAGIPESATLTLRSGTTVRSFTIPERLRRGIANTVFVGGTKDSLKVNLCSDRSPGDDEELSKCQKLSAQE